MNDLISVSNENINQYDDLNKDINSVNQFINNSFENILDFEVHLTTKCNMNCLFCGSDELEINGHPGIINDYQTVKQIINSAKKRGINRITFSGGEPLMNPDLFQIIEEADSNGFFVNVSTNGLLINDEYARFVSNKKVSTRISIHTLDKKKFVQITGVDALERVIESFDILKKYNAFFGMTATIFKLNVDEIPQLAQFAFDKGVYLMRFTPVYPAQRGEKYAADKQLIKKIMYLNARQIIKYYEYLELPEKTTYVDPIILDIITTRKCIAAEKRFTVFNAEKTTKPCPFYPEVMPQNIPEKCVSCDFVDTCSGGCIGLNVDAEENERFKCMREIAKEALSEFQQDDVQKILCYWQHIFRRYRYEKYSHLGCVRKLPIWEIIFNKKAQMNLNIKEKIRGVQNGQQFENI